MGASVARGGGAAAFGGFEGSDFGVFAIRDFARGMAALRERLTPKLEALGEALAPRLTAATGDRFHAHVARHARRTVNTPAETWVAFGRDERKYKAYAYLGVVASARGVDVRLVLKEEATDKGTLADALARERARLADLFGTLPGLGWYLGVPGRPHEPGAAPVPVADLAEGFWDDLAQALRTRRTSAVDVGFGWPRDDRRLAGPEFERLALRGLVALHPLYRLAARPPGGARRG